MCFRGSAASRAVGERVEVVGRGGRAPGPARFSWAGERSGEALPPALFDLRFCSENPSHRAHSRCTLLSARLSRCSWGWPPGSRWAVGSPGGRAGQIRGALGPVAGEFPAGVQACRPAGFVAPHSEGKRQHPGASKFGSGFSSLGRAGPEWAGAACRKVISSRAVPAYETNRWPPQLQPPASTAELFGLSPGGDRSWAG